MVENDEGHLLNDNRHLLNDKKQFKSLSGNAGFDPRGSRREAWNNKADSYCNRIRKIPTVSSLGF